MERNQAPRIAFILTLALSASYKAPAPTVLRSRTSATGVFYSAMIVRIEAEGRFYVKLSTDVLRRTDLSRAAKGLWAELLTHSDAWEVRTSDLRKKGPEGRDRIQKLLRELEAVGLAEFRVVPGSGSEWIIYSERREPENPVPWEPGNPGARKSRPPRNPAPKVESSNQEESNQVKTAGDSDFGGPDREEVIAVFGMAGGTKDQALAFWSYNEGLGWRRGASRVLKWQTLVKGWIDRDATKQADTKRRFAPERTPYREDA